jgi:hypothetical protein
VKENKMHHIRTTIQNPSDARSNIIHVFECSVCKNKEFFVSVPNFDTTRLRKCPKCQTIDDTNDKEYLLNKKKSLTEQINSLTEQLTKLENERMSIISKIEIMEFEQPMKVENYEKKNN